MPAYTDPAPARGANRDRDKAQDRDDGAAVNPEPLRPTRRASSSREWQPGARWQSAPWAQAGGGPAGPAIKTRGANQPGGRTTSALLQYALARGSRVC